MKFIHMYFSNDAGRRVRLTVRNARENVTTDEIARVMDLIISKNVFSPSLVQALGAEIEERNVTEL
ncbi:MAG: DUF2922 domain-containing protein [Synergistetes bacterium]|nr:DUF2922 domain-containing protein [Synergistota bacterium]MDW8192355.1 DUF2922 domain-containing protein [Synergistota bacterium]